MRSHTRISLLAVLCVACLSLGLAACGGSGHSNRTGASTQTGASTGTGISTDSGHTTQVTTSGTGVRKRMLSIMEVDGQLNTQVNTTVFAAVKALGITTVRFSVIWGQWAPDSTSQTEPSGFDPSNPGSKYNWAGLDNIVNAAHAAGINLYFTLTSPAPLWATGKNPPFACNKPADVTECQTWKPSASGFAEFVTAVGKRYSGTFTPAGAAGPLPRVSFWSLWNEPNYGSWLKPQSEPVAGTNTFTDTAAAQYRTLANAGWRALQATGHSTATDTILIGETAPAGEQDPHIGQMTPPLRFVRDLYCVSATNQPLTGSAATAEGCPPGGPRAAFVTANPALFKADGWADHPYGYIVPPTKPESTAASAADYADFARLPNLESQLDRAASVWGDDPKLPIFSSEYGYFTAPPATLEGEPDATVAKWMNWTEYLTWKTPRIASFDQYLLEDPPAGHGAFYSGLEYASGRPKRLVYDAFRLPLFLPVTTASHGRALKVWGCARPVTIASTQSRRVRIQFAARGRAFATAKTVTLTPATHGCYFDTAVNFPASGTVRLSYTDGTDVITSRPQTITVG